MARKQKSVYERIEETKNEINLAEERLAQFKSRLVELENEKDDLEMRQTWATIKSNGLTVEDIQKLLLKNNKQTK